MCGRFFVEVDEKQMQELLMCVEPDSARGLLASGEVYPSDYAAAMGMDGKLTAMQWGFSRPDGKGLLINARSETAANKVTFQKPMTDGRCLIPASWYFEWQKQGAQKTKYALRSPSAPILWLAALSRKEPDTDTKRFVILTRPAADGISFIHDRMPVIIPDAQKDRWLGGDDAQPLFGHAEENMVFEAV